MVGDDLRVVAANRQVCPTISEITFGNLYNTRAVILMSLLQVTGLCKTFGEVRAASDVCFEVRAGEIYGLLGPNGAGKTTTISMVSGLFASGFMAVIAAMARSERRANAVNSV